MKKNLIFFMSDFSRGGAGNSISRLCVGLSRKEYKISVISIGKCFYKKILKENKVKIFEIKKEKLIFSIFKLYKLLKKIYIPGVKNILVSNIHYNNIVLTLITKRIYDYKIILVERTPIEELDIYFSSFDFIKKKIIKFLINIIYPQSDLIVANSIGIKNGFSNKLQKKINVVYPPAISQILKIKKKKILKNSFKAVCFSRLSVEKNLQCVINSFKYLKNTNINLTIYGEGKLKKNLNNLINELNLSKKILIKKYNFEVQKEIKKYDLLISPSYFEGCSNSIIEALNHNLYILASDCPGGNSEILYNGKFGSLFKTNDELDLSLKLKKIMNNFEYLKTQSNKNRFTLKRFLLSANIKNFSKNFEDV